MPEKHSYKNAESSESKVTRIEWEPVDEIKFHLKFGDKNLRIKKSTSYSNVKYYKVY